MSPEDVRKNYMLYDNKAGTNLTAKEGIQIVREEMEESFKCIIGGNDGWKPWNECICRRYVGK